MHEVLAPVSSLLIHGVHRFASCWVIERLDGEILRFTDHERALVIDGETYTPAVGFSASAQQRVEGPEAQNAEVRGAFDDDALTEADLKAGKYLGATVSEFVVNWRWPWAGTYRRNRYVITATEWTGETWMASIQGMKVRLTQRVGVVANRTCRFSLGDAQCGIDLEALADAGTVAAVTEQRRVFTVAGITGTSEDGFFDHGEVRFANGTVREIKSQVGTLIELYERTSHDLAASDVVTLVPGCDKTLDTCRDKFSNAVRFGGFPYIPNTDRAQQSPDARSE